MLDGSGQAQSVHDRGYVVEHSIVMFNREPIYAEGRDDFELKAMAMEAIARKTYIIKNVKPPFCFWVYLLSVCDDESSLRLYLYVRNAINYEKWLL